MSHLTPEGNLVLTGTNGRDVKEIARIVPARHDGVGPQPTAGTRVLVGGVELAGVTSITLRAGVNSVWRATIECHVCPPEIVAEATYSQSEPSGDPPDITALSDTQRQYLLP